MRWMVEKDLVVPMRDGVELVADVHLPDGRGPFPALLQRVPYNRESWRIVNFALDIGRAQRAGYAVVVQDARGRFGSGGTFTPFLDEQADGEDTIAWVASQPWCDGRVGMVGGSYAGLAQWAAARARPPALRAIAPFVATDDWFDGWIYQNGVFELGFNLLWSLRNIASVEAARRSPSSFGSVLAANDHIAELYDRLPLGDIPELTEFAPFYREWLQEATPGGRWGGGPIAADTTTPALTIGGWYDVFQRGTLGSFARLNGTPRRLIMGPWAHGVYGGVYAERSFGVGSDADVEDITRAQLRWFDRWVKGEDNGVERDAPLQLFVMGADYWRGEDAWPPSDAVETVLFLHSEGSANSAAGDGTLSRDAPRDELVDTYTYDPRSPVPTVGGATFLQGLQIAANAGPRDQRVVEMRSDVLCYTSEALDAPVEVVGPVSAVLFVSSDAPDTDFVVTVTDVSPDGHSRIVTSGVVRARYRDSRSSPALLVQGRIYELAVDLGGTAHVFRPGHRIRVHVTSGSFPRFEPNPQTGALGAESADVQAATSRLHHDALHPSSLVLRVVERSETTERLAG